jgi:four helix bundle protein
MRAPCAVSGAREYDVGRNGLIRERADDLSIVESMDSYQSLRVWQRAHSLAIITLQKTDAARQPRTWAIFDQLRRAAVSVEANIVEGYALRAPRQFRRHLRIALGSAAESECLIRSAGQLGYLQAEEVKQLLSISDSTIALLLGLLRRPATQ